MRLGCLALALTLAACTPNSSDLTIEVTTDLLPGPEFDLVQVTVFRGRATRATGGEVARTAIRPAAFEEAAAFRAGQRVADFDGMGDGEITVRVQLARPPLGSGDVLLERWLTVTMHGRTQINVHLDAGCVAAECPAPAGSPAFSECLNGHCVDTLCNPDDPSSWSGHCCDTTNPSESCTSPIVFCATVAECGTPVSCTTASCDRGYCTTMEPAGACAEGTYCDHALGCTPLPASHGPDAGVADAGPSDAIACGTSCGTGGACRLGIWDCNGASPVCRVLAVAAGESCGVDQVCAPNGECIACMAGADCVPTEDCYAHGTLDCTRGEPRCVLDSTSYTVGAPCALPSSCRAGATPSCAADHTCQCGCAAGFTACGLACGCGAGCTTCPSGVNAEPTCTAGACGLRCATGFADCDGNAANGCETAAQGAGNDVLYCDGLEAGIGGWTLDSQWVGSTMAYDGLASLEGIAGACGSSDIATTTSDIDLSGVTSATLYLHSRLVGGALDTVEVRASRDGGMTWAVVMSLLPSAGWIVGSGDLTPFTRSANVRLQLAFTNVCGDCCAVHWYVDDLVIEGR